MQRLIIPPHPRLSPLILHLLAMRLDGCENRLPSALSPCLMLFVRGGSALRRSDGGMEPVPRASLCGPYLTARTSRSLAGTVFISVMFRPGLFDLAMGFPVSELGDGIVPLASVCGRAATDRLLDEVEGARHIPEAADAVQRFLLARLDERPRNAFGPAMLHARDQLFRPVRDIAAHFGIGERQLERRVRQSFGVSLRDLRRMTRFGHALARLVSAPVVRGDLTRIAQDFGYYDQAHMDREFVSFAGMAPSRLLCATAGEDPAYWVYRFERRDFGRLFLP